jgi:hypothetical protein
MKIAISCLLLSLLFISCGKVSEKKNKNIKLVNPLTETQIGIYQAYFLPINSGIAGMASGNALIKLFNNQFSISVSMLDLPQGIHPQYIYQGSDCPGPDNDLNQDGYIDAIEGEEVYGKALIPLDNNLTSQLEDDQRFPKASRNGSYQYNQLVDWKVMTNDLSLTDSNLDDHVMKLRDPLNIEGKIIVIHGIDNSIFLPSTVEGYSNGDIRNSLPIACAKIYWISESDQTR